MIKKAILLSLTIAAGAICSGPLLAQQESKDLPLENAKKQISSVNRRLSQNLAAGDINAVAACYTTDAQFMVPNMPSVNGRTGIKAVYLGMFKSGATNLELSTKELSGNENLLEEVGTYTLSTATGQELDRGKYLVVWRKEAKQWKLYRDCFNTDLPAKKVQN
jgi:ketosteroid isomerase-like protein